jgi:hypothetical protein
VQGPAAPGREALISFNHLGMGSDSRQETEVASASRGEGAAAKIEDE